MTTNNVSLTMDRGLPYLLYCPPGSFWCQCFTILGIGWVVLAWNTDAKGSVCLSNEQFGKDAQAALLAFARIVEEKEAQGHGR